MGRPLNSKNEKTQEWEIFRDHCLNGGLIKFKEEMDKLQGRDYVKAFLETMEYFKPRLARHEVRHEGGVDIKVKITRV